MCLFVDDKVLCQRAALYTPDFSKRKERLVELLRLFYGAVPVASAQVLEDSTVERLLEGQLDAELFFRLHETLKNFFNEINGWSLDEKAREQEARTNC